MVREIKAGKHSLLVCNLAPPDMVGHTGFMDKAIEAAAHTDMCVGKIRDACAEVLARPALSFFQPADEPNPALNFDCPQLCRESGRAQRTHPSAPSPSHVMDMPMHMSMLMFMSMFMCARRSRGPHRPAYRAE